MLLYESATIPKFQYNAFDPSNIVGARFNGFFFLLSHATPHAAYAMAGGCHTPTPEGKEKQRKLTTWGATRNAATPARTPATPPAPGRLPIPYNRGFAPLLTSITGLRALPIQDNRAPHPTVPLTSSIPRVALPSSVTGAPHPPPTQHPGAFTPLPSNISSLPRVPSQPGCPEYPP